MHRNNLLDGKDGQYHVVSYMGGSDGCFQRLCEGEEGRRFQRTRWV